MIKPVTQAGDVFTFPVGDNRYAVGQNVHDLRNGQPYFALFSLLLTNEDIPGRLDEALSSDVQILALSLDGRIYNDLWKVVAQRPVRRDIPFPAYKESVDPPNTFDVVDYTGRRRRRATSEEVEHLRFRAVASPMLVEKAFLATLGQEPWNDAYDKYCGTQITSREVFGDPG